MLDNESFAETGRQRGLTGSRIDIAAVAKGFGIARDHDRDRAGRRCRSWRELLFKAPGPVLAVAKIAVTDDPWTLPEKDGGTIAHRFRAALGVGRGLTQPCGRLAASTHEA